ncbi:MAG TPA: protein-methionine-sulfoxide reductase heme-binding subunit MsrQ [Candidatus Binatia bacterium]
MESVAAIKIPVFVACLYPLIRLAWLAAYDNLGANPIEFITRSTGTWTLVFLTLTLAVTPLRRLSGYQAAIRFRRMLGLFAFFYASLHLVTYIWLDQFFALMDMAADVMKRPFITVGFFSFLLLVPLALTSTSGMIRRLGGRRWLWLHRLVYVASLGGVVHFLWLVKADIREPLIYGSIVALLLAFRVAAAMRGVRTSLLARTGRRAPLVGKVGEESSGLKKGSELTHN